MTIARVEGTRDEADTDHGRTVATVTVGSRADRIGAQGSGQGARIAATTVRAGDTVPVTGIKGVTETNGPMAATGRSAPTVRIVAIGAAMTGRRAGTTATAPNADLTGVTAAVGQTAARRAGTTASDPRGTSRVIVATGAEAVMTGRSEPSTATVRGAVTGTTVRRATIAISVVMTGRSAAAQLTAVTGAGADRIARNGAMTVPNAVTVTIVRSGNTEANEAIGVGAAMTGRSAAIAIATMTDGAQTIGADRMIDVRGLAEVRSVRGEQSVRTRAPATRAVIAPGGIGLSSRTGRASDVTEPATVRTVARGRIPTAGVHDLTIATPASAANTVISGGSDPTWGIVSGSAKGGRGRIVSPAEMNHSVIGRVTALGGTIGATATTTTGQIGTVINSTEPTAARTGRYAKGPAAPASDPRISTTPGPRSLKKSTCGYWAARLSPTCAD